MRYLSESVHLRLPSISSGPKQGFGQRRRPYHAHSVRKGAVVEKSGGVGDSMRDSFVGWEAKISLP